MHRCEVAQEWGPSSGPSLAQSLTRSKYTKAVTLFFTFPPPHNQDIHSVRSRVSSLPRCGLCKSALKIIIRAKDTEELDKHNACLT